MNILIIGNGGHSKVVKDIILLKKEFNLVGYLDEKYEVLYQENGYYYGPISSLRQVIEEYKEIKIVIAIGNNLYRKNIFEELNLSDEFFLTVVHPSAVLSPFCTIGRGSVIMPNVVINSEASIGKQCIINTGAIVEHDSKISDFVHVSPSVTITGACQIGEGTHVGAGSTIIPNIRVGSWAVVGAGATVINDITANCLAVGTPAKVIKKVGVQFS